MASLFREQKGDLTLFRVQFTDRAGKRRSIRLGSLDERNVQRLFGKIEELIAVHLTNGVMAPDLASWSAKLSDKIAGKLAAAGLLAPRADQHVATLGGFVEQYLASRTDVKPGTMINLKQAQTKLIAHFGANRPLNGINAGEADDYRRKLAETLGDNTVRRLCGRARQFFRAAVRKKLVDANPFDMKNLSVRENRERDYYVTPAEANKAIEAAPDAEWRLIIALARFAGLRIPSELLALRWDDVLWGEGSIIVRSPKTAQYAGQDRRVIPIFAALKPHLEEAHELAPDGSEFVISRHRQSNINLRTQFERIVKRAGLTPWPKTFQNCRASMATDLAAQFPIHVASAWMGHSVKVAAKHYLQTLDSHFALARTATIAPPAVGGASSGANLGAGGASGGVAPQVAESDGVAKTPRKADSIALAATASHFPQAAGVPPTGFEPVT